MKGGSIALLAGSGLALVGGVTWLNRLGQIAKQIVVEQRSDFDRKRMEYIVNATVKNPVSQAITVKYPFVRLAYQGTVVASSQPKADKVRIPANGQVSFQLRIGFDREQVIRMAPGIATLLLAGGKVELDAVTLSGLITPVSTIEFSKTQKFRIGF